MNPVSRRSVCRPRVLFGKRRSAFGKHASGFTFIEILFAVIILGVGMIMIAGMLPVAIKQNADTRNDLTAKVVSESGYAYLRTLIQTHPEAFPETHGENTVGSARSINTRSGTNFEAFMEDGMMGLASNDEYTVNGGFPSQPSARKAGRVVPLTFDVVRPNATTEYLLGQANPTQRAAYPLMWHQSLLGDRISTIDPRFQWTAFYRRDEGSKIVRLYIIAMRLQNADVVPQFSAANGGTIRREEINGANGPFLVPIQVEDDLLNPDKLKFVDSDAGAIDRVAAASGSYLIIAHSPPLSGTVDGETNAGDVNRPYRNNGKILRLAQRRDDLDSAASGARVWELEPGYDLASADAGPDGIFGTPDDSPDGSMNAAISFTSAQQDRPADARQFVSARRVPVGGNSYTNVPGTTAYAWLIGRGRSDPVDPATPFTGLTQDISVLTVDVTLP